MSAPTIKRPRPAKLARPSSRPGRHSTNTPLTPRELAKAETDASIRNSPELHPPTGTIPVATLADLGFNPQGDRRAWRLEPGDDPHETFFATHTDLVGGFGITESGDETDGDVDELPQHLRDFFGV